MEACAGEDTEEAPRAIRDHLRVTATGGTVLHMAGQLQPAIQDTGQAGG